MAFLATRHQRAQVVIGLLGAGLLITMWPYVTGLLGAPVLYVVFNPLYELLRKRLKPAIAAAIVVATATLVILVPGASIVTLVINEAQSLAGGLIQSPLVGRLADLQVGDFAVGPRLVRLGENAVQWIGSSALDLMGTATKLAFNLTIAMFGLYFLLVAGGRTWEAVSPYIPFNAANTEQLRIRFRDVTYSTLIGTGLIAVVQGGLVGGAFAVADLPNAAFWGVVTGVFAILPVVGSGLVWGPGAVALMLGDRVGGEGAVETDDHRGHLLLEEVHLDPLERCNRVQMHKRAVVRLVDLFRRAPGAFELIQAGDAGSDAFEAGRFDFDRAGVR